jgi:DNA-binding SARP family transcriptional activator
MRRRRVTSRSLPGAAVTPGDPEFEDLRSSIAQSDDQDYVARLAGALRDAAAQLVRIKSAARPRLVQCSRRGVEILLSASALPAPPEWRPQASGAVWVCPQPSDGDDRGCPAPVLVTLGREEGGTTLHLDLETEGCVAVVGSEDAVMGFGRSLLVELAHSRLAETLAVIVVGTLDGAEAGLERISSAPTWADILETATAWAGQSSQALAANRWASGLHARASGGSNDAISPLVILATSSPSPDELAALQELPIPSALTIVALGWDLPIATRIEVDDRELRIPALGVSCAPQELAPATVRAVGAVLAEAEAPLIAAPRPATSSLVDVDLRDPYVDPPHEILVRVLGDIEVVGGRRPLSPLQTATVAYIALHTPVAASRVEDAVWTSPTANRHKRLANTVSEARAALGAHHFPVATDGRYSVGPAVVTDLSLFEGRVAYAATQSGLDAIETLGGALEMVRGPVFSYRSAERTSFVWVDLENWAVTAELVVIDAALRLGELFLESGDAAGAVRAATTGLAVSPAHSGLTELLMRAHAAGGDRHAAGLVFENHVNALQALDLDDVDESTLNLRAALLGGSVRRD